MEKHSEDDSWDVLRRKVIGLGEKSLRKNYYNELQNRLEDLERFRFLLDCTKDTILVSEIPSGNIIDINKSASDFLGYSKDEFLSMKISDLLEGNIAESINNISVNFAPENKNQTVFSTVIKTNNSIEIPVELSVDSSCFNSKLYAVILIRDIREKKKTELLKSEFLAQISHEIRTPVNTILNYITLLKEELHSTISAELSHSFRAIDNGSRRLINTIDSLINISQIQTGNYDYTPVNIDLEKDIIEKVIFDFHYYVNNKGIKLNYSSTADRPVISGDIFSIMQIFSHLIDNAVKYTCEGKIDVFLYNREDALCIDISDTGIGISESFIPHLFEPFSQEDTGDRRKFDGNGLGLALVLKYAELNNADVRVKSKKGKGTTFTVIFRLEQEQA